MSDNEVNEQENSEIDKIDKFFALPQDIQDNLAMMFLMQEKLNDFTFLNNGITANDGSILTTQVFRQEVASAKFYPETTTLGPNTNAVKWMANYAEALFREVIELKDAIPWKWWSKSKAPIADIQEEIADAWHFLISETLAAGMTPNDIILAYCNKYNKNIERQKQAYVARGDVAA
jgi:hypothetical protein